MVKIFGKCSCNDCHWEEEDPDFQLQCPHCQSFRVVHELNPKIILCTRQNPEGFATGNLSKLSKQVNKKIKGRDQTYSTMKNYIQSQTVGSILTSKRLIQHFNGEGITDGDTIRNIANLLTCECILDKEFMKNKNYHSYTCLNNTSMCPHLKQKTKGKNIGVYYCDFDFKNNGEVLKAKDIFDKNEM